MRFVPKRKIRLDNEPALSATVRHPSTNPTHSRMNSFLAFPPQQRSGGGVGGDALGPSHALMTVEVI
jgi:hypothetical protein